MKKQQIVLLDVLFVLIIILLFGLSYLSYVRIERLKDASFWVNHSNEIKVHLNAAFVNILDSETNLRGYIITGNEKNLNHFREGFVNASKDIQKALELTSDNPKQHKEISNLEKLLERRLDYMNETLKQYSESPAAIATKIDSGRLITDTIRVQLKQMHEREDRLLRDRVRTKDSAGSFTPVLVLAFSIVAIVLVTLAYMRLRRETHLRMSAQDKEATIRRLQEQTRALADTLERKVDERTNELQQKNITLENINNELLSFNYVASHDLQEPLRKIRAFISRIEDNGEKFSPATRNYFERINSAASRMQKLLEALISYSRANNIDEDFVPADLNTILNEVKSDLNEMISEKRATVTSGELPVMRVVPMQIHQLFTNIIANALKYANPVIDPVIEVNAEVINNPRDIKKDVYLPHARYWKISFSDNGIGFEKDYEDKIFELFQRLHGKNEFEGTGIGLAICRKIMQNHGGYIFAEGAPGKGATFSIYFPITYYESV